jgi:hypothetical protein
MIVRRNISEVIAPLRLYMPWQPLATGAFGDAASA